MAIREAYATDDLTEVASEIGDVFYLMIRLCDEIGIPFLFRPRDLSDREKFVLDQFVMRGGTMVVLADVVDYSIGQKRTFSRTPMALDEKGSEWSFREQLLCYGIDLKDQIVADLDN